MSKFFKTFITSTTVVLFAILLSGSVYATDKPAISPQISPVNQRVILRANEVSEHKFTMTNDGSKDFNFTTYVTPYGVTGEEYNADFSTASKFTQVSRWITFRQEDGSYVDRATYNLASGQKKEITYRVSVPADVPAGAQYATILAEVFSADANASGGVRAVPRLSIIIYGRSEGDTKYQPDVADHKVPGILIDKEIEVSSLVKNGGNTDFDAVHKLKVSSFFGKKLFEDSIAQPVHPEKPRRATLKYNHKPLFGIYRVEYEIKAHDRIFKRTSIVLSMSGILLIILLILLTIGVAWLIIFFKQRKERDSRQLV